jgi:hypothetical protein
MGLAIVIKCSNSRDEERRQANERRAVITAEVNG